ncbi:arylsulfatase [uncultured Parasphingorhabdus sp.]|uniref:arylsulfatase n=1 Tax=uncultured Parasphingorhabdus sp. TaxID=2709694 RepID=UPI002AA5E833|nr:arylsulfatase [uncultured Parasphingorhabdus sp.]
MNRLFNVCCLAILTLSTTPTLAQQSRPNFLVVVADDMGWSDPGFLGSKIRTPTIDRLAKRGIFMSNFYVAPTCSPTRAMLMTGVSNHAAGVGTMRNMQSPNQHGRLEYAAQLHSGVVTVAEMLSAHGYRTMMSGKWHLAVDANQWPHRRGFQRSFGLVEGGASHFADQMLITPTEDVTYHEDGKVVPLTSDFYSTIGYTDKIIEYIQEAGEKPFFAYVAYTAPHDPLQVPAEWMDRYKGVFDEGPAKAKEKRRQRLIELGLIGKDAELAQTRQMPAWLDSHKKPWTERSESERKSDAKRMEIYAAMVELLDQQFGRIIEQLRRSGQLDNTYVLFMSDNGASASTPLVYLGNSREWVHDNFDLSDEAMGTRGSYTTMGADWANNSNTPFNLFKGTIAEGGVRSPLIIAGPNMAEGVIRKMPGHVMDLTPTFFELAGINPAEDPLYKGKLQPAGQSIMSILQEDKADDNRMLVTELFGNRMVRKGRWKAEYMHPPFGSGEWELFDIVADPSATENLAEEQAGLLAEMRKAYDNFAGKNHVTDAVERPSRSSSVTFEGECNWWCETKFGFVDVLANRTQRNLLFAAILVVPLLGGFAWYRNRRKKHDLQVGNYGQPEAQAFNNDVRY